MGVNVILFFIFYYLANASSQRSDPHVGRIRSLPVVDALISRLAREHWAADDGACLRATLDMLRGVNNNTLWATWVWDSMQLPAGSLYGAEASIGNYEQCLRAPWSADQRHPGLRSQYCLVDVRGPATEQVNTVGPFGDTEKYYRTLTKDGRRFNLHNFGACLPSICSTSSVARISQHLLRLTHLPEGDVTVDPRNCETSGEVTEYPSGFYVFWAVLGIFIATTIISTVFVSEDTMPAAYGTITQSFCLKRNYRSLFAVSRDEVRVMHGMRFLTAVLIVIIHELYFGILFPTINGLDINKFVSSPWGQAIMHLEVIVDTFFTMSGLLLVRGLMMGKQKNLIYTLVKRYIRLIGPFALCILYFATTCEYMASGPLWRKSISFETEGCKFWWKSLLMSNTDVATLCYSVSWYISCDFQIAVLGTFLFYLFKRNRNLGIGAFVAVAVGLTVNLGLTVYRKQLDIIPFNFNAIIQKRVFVVLNETYLTSHARAGPYFVGMVMGYIISTYRPAEHRNVIGKQWSVVITTVSLLVGSAIVALGAIFAGRPYNPLEAAVVVATNRAFWGVMICSLITVCEYGSLTLIPRFLGWPGFVPLSKLSYCIYLLHSILIQLHKFSARTADTYSFYNVIINASGVLVLTCGFSLALHLVLEAPLCNIANAMFTEKPKPLEQHSTKADTMHNGNGVTHGLQINGKKTKLL